MIDDRGRTAGLHRASRPRRLVGLEDHALPVEPAVEIVRAAPVAAVDAAAARVPAHAELGRLLLPAAVVVARGPVHAEPSRREAPRVARAVVPADAVRLLGAVVL